MEGDSDSNSAAMGLRTPSPTKVTKAQATMAAKAAQKIGEFFRGAKPKPEEGGSSHSPLYEVTETRKFECSTKTVYYESSGKEKKKSG